MSRKFQWMLVCWLFTFIYAYAGIFDVSNIYLAASFVIAAQYLERGQ